MKYSIKEKEQTFTPIDITFSIENEDDLKAFLWITSMYRGSGSIFVGKDIHYSDIENSVDNFISTEDWQNLAKLIKD